MKIHWGPDTRVGYLSAAPRVSTCDDAEASGPRAHILGVIGALEATGATVERFIVGDRMPRRVRVRSELLLRGNPLTTLAADAARLGLGAINARRAWGQLGRVDWVYERAAALQSLGWTFKRRGIPWILETNSPISYEARTERASLVLATLARKRELAAYTRCDVLVCVSEELRELIAADGIERRKMVVVPNGVDTSLFDPDRHRDAERYFTDFTIGFAGTLAVWQGLELLIEAVAGLRARGLAVAVAIVGDGPTRQRGEQRARELDIAQHVRFLGRLPGSAIPRFLAGVDVAYSGQTVLELGRMYHSPLKLYEYMAMARPIVASEFADSRALVDEGVTGFLFRAGDATDLERALAAAYAARDRLTELGREARRQVLARHSWHARLSMMRDAIEAI